MLLDNVLAPAVTVTVPVVVPVGTVVVISVPETTVNVAGVPLNATAVVPVKFDPRIVTFAPTLPEVGRVLTNGLSPVASLKRIP